MPTDTRLLFYGDSVFLAGLKAELATAVAPLHILTLPADTPNPLQAIHNYHPQALIFDLTTPATPDFVIPLLQQQPGLLLIGVNPSCDNLLVLSGQAPQVAHINDLITLIHQQITDH